MIIGIGEKESKIEKEIRRNRDKLVVGFIDNEGKMEGMEIIGMSVYRKEEIKRMIEN